MKNRPEKIFVVVPPGLESVCSEELRQLGVASQQAERGGIEFSGGLRELYLANLWLRSASRVLVRVGEFRSRDFPDLFRKCRLLPWGRFLRPGQSLAVRVTCRKSRLLHSDRVEQVIREGVAKALGPATEQLAQPEALLVVKIVEDRCQVSIDSSGEHLHRRGYRQHPVAAPLRENLAAGLLLSCGWDDNEALVDPLCGSGTFAIEAALLAARIPPGGRRKFAFMDWPGFRNGLWTNLLQEARRRRRQPVNRIFARELRPEVLAAARENAVAAEVAELIDWQQGDVLKLPAPAGAGLLLTNPPYGERLGERNELDAWFAALGQCCADRYRDWRLALVVPDQQLVRGWARPLHRQLSFKNGGLAVSLVVSG